MGAHAKCALFFFINAGGILGHPDDELTARYGIQAVGPPTTGSGRIVGLPPCDLQVKDSGLGKRRLSPQSRGCGPRLV